MWLRLVGVLALGLMSGPVQAADPPGPLDGAGAFFGEHYAHCRDVGRLGEAGPAGPPEDL